MKPRYSVARCCCDATVVDYCRRDPAGTVSYCAVEDVTSGRWVFAREYEADQGRIKAAAGEVGVSATFDLEAIVDYVDDSTYYIVKATFTGTGVANLIGVLTVDWDQTEIDYTVSWQDINGGNVSVTVEGRQVGAGSADFTDNNTPSATGSMSNMHSVTLTGDSGRGGYGYAGGPTFDYAEYSAKGVTPTTFDQCTVFDDDFNRADNTDINEDAPCTWETSGSLEIASNRVVGSGTAYCGAMSEFNGGVVKATVFIPSATLSSNAHRIIWYYTDDDNYDYVEVDRNGSTLTAKLYNRVGGTSSEQDSDTATVSGDVTLTYCITYATTGTDVNISGASIGPLSDTGSSNAGTDLFAGFQLSGATGDEHEIDWIRHALGDDQVSGCDTC